MVRARNGQGRGSSVNALSAGVAILAILLITSPARAGVPGDDAAQRAFDLLDMAHRVAEASEPVRAPALAHDRLAAVALGHTFDIDGFSLTRDRTVDLALERFTVFTPDARFVVAGRDGQQAMPLPDVVLLRGTVAGDAASHVYLAISPSGTHGFVREGGRMHIVTSGARAEAEHFALQINDAANLDLDGPDEVVCGNDDDNEALYPLGRPAQGGHRPEGGPGSPTTCRSVRVAVDSDWEFTGTLFGGDTVASAAYATSLLGAISEIYNGELNTTLTVPFLRVWSSNTDPYTATTGTLDALIEYRDYWRVNETGVSRDIAHLLSGKSLGGGIAYVGALCNDAWGFGLSANLNGTFPYPLQDHHSGNWDVIVVAHELGHNFGTGHTHEYAPPIDDCGTGGCSSPYGGTIMSYCHLCAGGLANIQLHFDPRVLTTINTYLDGLVCDLTVPCADPGDFIGASGGSWFVGANWSDGQVPTGAVDVTLATLVRIDGPGAVANTVTIQSGGTLEFSGGGTLAAGTTTVESAGALTGAGTITGNVVNDGSVAPGTPGAPTGVLAITGDCTQNAGGALAIEVDGYTPGAQHDQVTITGTATLGGDLTAALLGGFTPAASTVTYLTGGTVSGAFATSTIPAIPGNWSFVPRLTSTDGALVTVPIASCGVAPISQWADSVIGFSSQWSTGPFSAARALGAPQVFAYENNQWAWASAAQDGTLEHITLGFPEPVYATGVTVRETWGNGMVYQVDVVDMDDVLQTVWTGTDPSVPGTIADFLITWAQTAYLVKGVKVYIDTDATSDWEEIDAVQLHGVPGPQPQWASNVVDYSSEWSDTIFSAAQATGAPNVFTYGNNANAWAPSSQDGTQEYVTLGFATAVYATGVTVRETYGNGFVTRVDVVDLEDALHTVWTGSDPSATGSPVDFKIEWGETPYLVDGVRIHVDTDATGVWEEVDAVALHGVEPDAADCNTNGVIDACDIAAGTSVDVNGDGIPDECVPVAAGAYVGAPGGSWFVASNWGGGAVPGAGTAVTIDASVVIDVPGALAGSITIEDDGVLTLDTNATLVVTGAVTVAPDGMLSIGNATMAALSITVQDQATMTMTHGGADVTASTVTIEATGTLTGTGTIQGNVTNGGAFRPGYPTDLFVIIGTYTQLATGTLYIEIEGYTAGIDDDVVTVSGLITLAGALDVADRVGFTPVADGVNLCLIAPAFAGAFDEVTLASLTGDFAFAVHQTPTEYSITTVAAASCDVTLASQWASSVIGFSSEFSAGLFGSMQTLGPPDVGSYAIDSDAWAASTQNGTLEHLTLGFDTPVHATGVTVRETYGNGFVYRIDAVDTDDVLHTVWTGTDTSLPGAPADFLIEWPITTYLAKGVKIFIDTDATIEWEQIDAVQLHGAPGSAGAWSDTLVDYSSEWSDGIFSAAQAVGSPNVFTYGNNANAWAASSQDGTLEYVTVGASSPVYATGVTVRETWGNGFVYRVDVVDLTDTLHTVWTGADPSSPGQIADFLIEWPQTAFLVDGVRVHVDTDASADWEEIDAIMLHGVSVTEADCNTNGIVDACDIASGFSLDANADGIPDECAMSPTVASLSGAPDPVDQGQTLTLTANTVQDANGDVTEVRFFYDADDDGVLEGTDTLLGTDASAAGGWTWPAATGSYAPGDHRFFARAFDSGARESAPAVTVVTVFSADPGEYVGAPGGAWSNGANWGDGTPPDAGTDVIVDTAIVIDAPGAVANTVTIRDGGTLTLTAGGATLTAATVTIEIGGILTGAGGITANVVNGGTLQPGYPVGSLSITGDYTQQATGILALEVDGYTPATEYDVVPISGTATLDGTVIVTDLPSFTPVDGNTVIFLGASSVSGTFSVEDLPDLDNFAFAVSNSGVQMLLVTVAVDDCAIGETKQWASSVIAFSSQIGSGGYAAAQTLGVPTVDAYEINPRAWAASSQNGTLEFLTLGVDIPVYATGVTVRETHGNGYVYQIDVVDTSDVLHTVWTGTDPSAPGVPADFRVTWAETTYLVKGVKVYIDTDATADWEQVDAVQIEGRAEPVSAWASSVIGYSSQWDPGYYSAAQTLGPANVFAYGDSRYAWAASSRDGTQEHLTVGFDPPMFATGATVREVLGNGFVTQVDVVDTDDVVRTVWTGVDSSAPGTIVDFVITWPRTEYAVKGVKIYIDTDATTDFEEIDSVSLQGFPASQGAWASSVIDFSSQWSPGSFSAEQAIGFPNVFGYQNKSKAWASANQNGTLEYLTMGFHTPVYATGVTVRETYGNGFVYQVDVVDTDDALNTVWTGTDPSPQGVVSEFLIEWTKTPYLVKGVKIYVDTDASVVWEEIDAVRLHGDPAVTDDCNGNGINDACDIASGESIDGNTNGIPDECEGAAYWNGGDGLGDSLGGLDFDEEVDARDVLTLLIAWGACAPRDEPCVADVDGDGVVDFRDLEMLLSAWSGR